MGPAYQGERSHARHHGPRTGSQSGSQGGHAPCNARHGALGAVRQRFTQYRSIPKTAPYQGFHSSFKAESIQKDRKAMLSRVSGYASQLRLQAILRPIMVG
jgi:hypothetical protein